MSHKPATGSTAHAAPPPRRTNLLALAAGEDAQPAAHHILLAGALYEGRRHQEVAGQQQLPIVLHHAGEAHLHGAGASAEW